MLVVPFMRFMYISPLSPSLPPAGADYSSFTATVQFSPNATAPQQLACRHIPILQDSMLEDTESFSVSLTSINDNIQFHISTASVSIEDDDTVTALIMGAEFRWQEGAGPAEVCVELQGLRERDVRVVLTPRSLTAQGLTSHTHIPVASQLPLPHSITTLTRSLHLSSAGLDFDSSPQPLLFTSNSSRACASFTIINDVILEGVESFEVSLSAEEDPAILFGLSSVVVEIEDDDQVTVGVVEESYTVAEEGGAVEVCIRLAGTIERVVTVTMATEGGSATGKYNYNYVQSNNTFPPQY